MRRGVQGLALQLYEQAKRDPSRYIFRGRRGDLRKILGMIRSALSLYAKRLQQVKFVSPLTKEGVIFKFTPSLRGSPEDDRTCGYAEYLLSSLL
jgi:transposase